MDFSNPARRPIPPEEAEKKGMRPFKPGEKLWHVAFKAEFPAPTKVSIMPVYFHSWIEQPTEEIQGVAGPDGSASFVETLAACKLRPTGGAVALAIRPDDLFRTVDMSISRLQGLLAELRVETAEVIEEHRRECTAFLEDTEYLVGMAQKVARAIEKSDT